MESRKQTTPGPRRPRDPPAEHRKPVNFSNSLYSTQAFSPNDCRTPRTPRQPPRLTVHAVRPNRTPPDPGGPAEPSGPRTHAHPHLNLRIPPRIRGGHAAPCGYAADPLRARPRPTPTIRAQYARTPRAARMPLNSRCRCLRHQRNDVTATVNHHARRTTERRKHGQNDQSPPTFTTLTLAETTIPK